MPLVTMGNGKNKVDGSVKALILDFLQKLQDDDTSPGLHIEPMNTPRDPRARTGRVNLQYRAVLFLLNDSGQRHYVYFGTFNHDEAIRIARNTVLTMNPALAIPEFRTYDDGPAVDPQALNKAREEAWQQGFQAGQNSQPTTSAPSQENSQATTQWQNKLPEHWDVDSLRTQAGVDPRYAVPALAATTTAELHAVVDDAPETQGLVLLGLAQGDSLTEVFDSLGIEPATSPAATSTSAEPAAAPDEAIVQALKKTTLGFTYVGDSSQELRDALESQDIDRWRVYLHPEQKRYATGSWNGPYRLSGGAGTGKTVVLLHRARYLYQKNPAARIVLTTFTRMLSGSLAANLTRLSAALPQVKLGEPGIAIAGIDQIAHQVLKQASPAEVAAAAETLLGPAAISDSTRLNNTHPVWNSAVAATEPELPEQLCNPVFLDQEYDYVILPQRITSEADYIRASRAGRGTALNRRQRKELWKVVAQFRRLTQMDNQLTFREVCALAAIVLENRGEGLADHVLVDEAQDFTPLHWQLLRAMAAEGQDDLFIAEDSNQRIYGNRLTLSNYGINIRGRSRRLRLNYRTTAEILGYAMTLLEGEEITDLEGGAEVSTDYRSVRSGPAPEIIAVTDDDSEIAAVTQRIKQWQDEGVKAEAIGILTRSEKRGSRAVEALTAAGVPAHVQSRNAAPQQGSVPVLTMHAAKGIEFQNVVVLGAGSDEIPALWALDGLSEGDLAEALTRERSLLYVAATRARDHLLVTYHPKQAQQA